MRICLLKFANPFAWTHHYTEAFRQFGEVLTVGPPFDDSFMAAVGAQSMPPWAKRNDIEAHLSAEVDLAALLPEGWVPDLVVGISDFGRPMSPGMNGLACPKVYLSIDTWQSPIDYIDAMQYDFVFAAQREFVPRLRATGARRVEWLPLACNPDMHHPVDSDPRFDITFVGSAFSHVHAERRRLLEVLRKRFAVGIQQVLHGEAMSRFFCQGRLAFNHSAVADFNMRIFETLAMGCTLLTNVEPERNGLLELFEDRKHLLIYRSEQELIELARAYLADDQARTEVARAGYAKVLEKHTYAHRVKTILDAVAAEVPGFGNPAAWPPRTGAVLAELIPAGAGTIIDLGFHLHRGKETLRHLGLRTLIGIGRIPPDDTRPWDATCVWPGPGPYPGEADVVLIESFAPLVKPPQEVIRFARERLGQGGTLLFRLSAGELMNLGVPLEPEALNQWLRGLDLHLLEVRAVNQPAQGWPPGLLFQTRKRTRTLVEVVDEGLAALPVDASAIREFARQFPEGM